MELSVEHGAKIKSASDPPRSIQTPFPFDPDRAFARALSLIAVYAILSLRVSARTAIQRKRNTSQRLISAHSLSLSLSRSLAVACSIARTRERVFVSAIEAYYSRDASLCFATLANPPGCSPSCLPCPGRPSTALVLPRSSIPNSL